MSFVIARSVVKEMLADRKYMFISENMDTMIYSKPDNNIVYIFLIDIPKLNIDVIRPFQEILDAKKIQHAVVVYGISVTSSAKNILDTMSIQIELFSAAQLQYNITKHVLVPRHALVDAPGHPERNNYPIIKKTDPISRYYGFASGQVVRIVRKNGSIYFRIVR